MYIYIYIYIIYIYIYIYIYLFTKRIETFWSRGISSIWDIRTF